MSLLGLAGGLFAAGSWAVASHLFSRLFAVPKAPTASAAVLFKNIFAGVIFFLIAWAISDGSVPSGAFWQMVISGALGFAIGDALFFAALPLVGVQTTAVASLANVPLTVIGAHWLFGEQLDPLSLWGGGLVLAGVLLVLRSGGGGGSTDPRLRRRGVWLALANALAISIAILSGHGGMQESGVFSGAAVRLLGGVAGAFGVALLFGIISGRVAGELQTLTRPLHQRRGLRPLLIASFIGSVLGLIPYHLALRELSAGVAALVFSTSPLFALPFARLGVAEARRTTPSMILGTLLGFAGVGVVLLAQSSLAQEGTAGGDTPVKGIEVHAQAEGPAGFYPRLGDEGRVLATRPLGDGEHALIGSQLLLQESKLSFTEAEILVQGSDWFVNWADTPAISPDGGLITWLQKAGKGTYDYHVQFAFRGEDGSFTEQGPIHDHTGPGEHGFASLTGLDGGRALAVWLDGRLMNEKGPMTLMSRVIAADGSRGPESVLDGQTCECCPTSLISLADGGALAAWRDRSDEGMRDILVARWMPKDGWGEPFMVHADNWKYPACPVNGPTMAVHGSQVALVWYTQDSTEKSFIRVALSDDSGKTFGSVRQLDRGHAMGQVSACFDAQGRLLVSWLEKTKTAGAWVVRSVGETLGEVKTVAEVLGRRSDGRARLTALGRGWALVWTDAEGGHLAAAAIH